MSFVGGIILDITKAFDLVNRCMLNKKLQLYQGILTVSSAICLLFSAKLKFKKNTIHPKDHFYRLAKFPDQLRFSQNFG